MRFTAALLAPLALSAGLAACGGRTMLESAIDDGNPAAVEAAARKAKDLNALGTYYPPLIYAAQNKHKAAVELLLGLGADPNVSGSKNSPGGTAYYWAMREGAVDIGRLMIEKGFDIRRKDMGDDALTLASMHDLELVKLILSKGADINSANDVPSFPSMANPAFRTTPIARAALANKMDIVDYLFEHGADLDGSIDALDSSASMLEKTDYGASTALSYRQVAQILRRLAAKRGGPAQAAAASGSGGISKAEMAEMVKAAVASAQQPAAASKPAEDYRSDVDAPAYKAAEIPNAYALVVGVEKYNTLPEARFAERDAKAMSAHLLAMGYPQRNIVLLTGAQATKTGLIKNLEAWLPNNANERSTVFFYFSGHGAPDAATSQAYLVPADGDPQYLAETAYPMARLYEKLQSLKAKRVIVALDSCFSGGGGRSVLAQGTRPLVGKLKAPPMGRVVSLSASAADEITGTAEDQGHGLFTYQFLKALSDTAGRGTVAELYESLKPRVQDAARRQNRGQTPQLSGEALDA